MCLLCADLTKDGDRMEQPKKSRLNSLVMILLFAGILLALCGNLILGSGKQRVFREDMLVTVGQQGDYLTLGEALSYLSGFTPAYEDGGLLCEVRILSGTTIREQIAVCGTDLQYITITSEDPVVPVDSMGWEDNGLNYHDLRGDVAFLGAENGGGLPTVGTVFQLQTKGQKNAAACFLNRDSHGILLPGAGFDGFYDGCIVNNESSLVMREAVSRNMTRWGIHARHNGEIEARSADLTGCGLSVYGDRAADLDVRNADVRGSLKALDSRNLSRINANGCEIYYCAGREGYVVYAEAGGEVNCTDTDIQYCDTDVFGVKRGGTIYASGAKVVKKSGRVFSQETNTVTADGVIYE